VVLLVLVVLLDLLVLLALFHLFLLEHLEVLDGPIVPGVVVVGCISREVSLIHY
jgi:hypothetical protein